MTEHSCCHHSMRKWPCWLPWLGLFGPSSFSASKGSWGCRAEAGGSLRSGQKTARGPRLRALSQLWLLPRYISITRLAFTQWLACTVHSFMYLFIHFLSPLHPYYLSFPIFSLFIHWLFPPPFLCWRAGKIRCQICTGPGRIGPLSLWSHIFPMICNSLFPPTDYSFLSPLVSCYRFTDASFNKKETWALKGLSDSPKITQLLKA